MNKQGKHEKEILESAERGEWGSIRNLEGDRQRYLRYARSFFLKDKRINIRISSQDLQGVQRRALEEGIPYQTLIASLIHKYVMGNLVEPSGFRVAEREAAYGRHGRRRV